jgi:hypothetical protein
MGHVVTKSEKKRLATTKKLKKKQFKKCTIIYVQIFNSSMGQSMEVTPPHPGSYLSDCSYQFSL